MPPLPKVGPIQAVRILLVANLTEEAFFLAKLVAELLPEDPMP
jgi:hypothetical protein